MPEIIADAGLERTLKFRIDGRCNAPRLRAFLMQTLGQQRRAERWLQGACGDRFDLRVVDFGAGPHVQVGHAFEHLVACCARGVRITVWSQTAGRLRQDREKCSFRVRKA